MPRPELVRTGDAFRQALDRARAEGRAFESSGTCAAVGFVPTMGALHPGHLDLVRTAKTLAPFVALSIFVNPTQFAPNEDLARYPRDLDGDLAKCEAAGVDLVFAPGASEMYPPGDSTRVRVAGLADHLCGPFRPGHFEGVATVVAKLFALASPCVAVFGRKDYQQLRIIERLAEDLLFAVRIVGAPTVRDTDGLALSSRNAYLSPSDRERARSIPRALAAACAAFASGERRAGALRKMVEEAILPGTSRIDYVSVVDPLTLVPFDDDARLPVRALLAVAVRVGNTRLIDNVVLGEDRSPLEGVT